MNGKGDVAQMVERSLSMREVRGSIPRISIYFKGIKFSRLFVASASQSLKFLTQKFSRLFVFIAILNFIINPNQHSQSLNYNWKESGLLMFERWIVIMQRLKLGLPFCKNFSLVLYSCFCFLSLNSIYESHRKHHMLFNLRIHCSSDKLRYMSTDNCFISLSLCLLFLFTFFFFSLSNTCVCIFFLAYARADVYLSYNWVFCFNGALDSSASAC